MRISDWSSDVCSSDLPDIFCAALLNSQPMGFYAPAQIVRDAQDHGVEIRPVCVNASRWDCTLEPTADDSHFAVRLGLRMVKGLANANAAAIVGARAGTPFASIDDLWRRAGVPVTALVQIAEADRSEEHTSELQSLMRISYAVFCL